MQIGEILMHLRDVLPHEGAEMTAHEISRNRERAIGVFPREGRAARETAIGGIDNRSYDTVRVTLLLRWGRKGSVAEAKAAEIYVAVAERDENFGFVRAVNDAPVWLGMDERGICEYVIDFDVYMKREGKYGISGE